MEDLDDAIALVYAQPPGDFVVARTALVKQLKADKRKDDAATVAALRRPTKLAWALGQAVRRAPDPATAYFDAIAALGQPGADLRRRTAELRDAVAALARAAQGVEAGEAIAAFMATAADPDATRALRLGRLADVPAAGGFGPGALSPGPAEVLDAPAPAADHLQEGAPGKPADEERPGQEGPDRDEAAEQERREQAKRERAAHRAAAAAEVDEAAAAEAAAADRVSAAQAAVEAAQLELATARAALEQAHAAAEEAAERLRAVEQG